MNTLIRQTGRRCTLNTQALLAAAGVAAVLTAALPASAADKAWSTAPTSNAFSGTNWVTGTVATAPANTTVVSGDNLFFGNSSIVFLNEDLAAGTSFAGFTFNPGASAYTFAGNAFTLAGNLTNNSTAAQTFLNAITINQNTTVAIPTAAGTTNAAVVSLNGSINGGAFALNKTGPGTLNLNAANTYSGGTTVTGVVAGNVAGAFGTGSVTVNNVAGSYVLLGANQTFANNFVLNGGGVAGLGLIFVNAPGTTNLTGPITVNAAATAGGHLATVNSASVLNVVGDNTITANVPLTVRNGLIKFLGAQNYTTGTILNGPGAALQFARPNSMPASGAITFTAGATASVIVNAGGAGEFTDGNDAPVAGTIGGLLAGIGGQGAPVNFVVGSGLGIDTSNATTPLVINRPFTATNNPGLNKFGAGTLSLTAGGTFTGGANFSLSNRQGTLNLGSPAGGPNATYAVTGEFLTGGTFGTAAGATGFDAVTNVTNATVTVSGFASVGRGNGTGTVTSDLNLTGSTLTSAEFSMGFNGGNVLNLSRQTATLNNSTYTTTGNAFRLSESAGSVSTYTANGTSATNINSVATTAITYLGDAGTANVVLNDASTFTVAANTAQLFIGRLAGSVGRVTLNGTSTFTHNGNASGTLVGEAGIGVINVASPTATVNVRNLVPGHAANGVGAVYNRGTMLGINQDGLFLGDGATSNSYFLNDNGQATTPNAVAANIVAGIGNNSNAVVDNASGTLAGVRVGGGFFQNTLNTNAQFNVTGGTLSAGATGLLNGDSNARTGNKFLNVNVTGGTLSSTGPVDLSFTATNAANVGTVSVTGGVVEANTITATNAAGSAVLSFGGGTLRAITDGTAASLVTANVDRVQITAGGMTVDTNGINKSIDAPIATQAGDGITVINLSSTTNTGYVGRPLVKITDPSGTGATAIANWDPATGAVTGVTITSPGDNYSNPLVTVSNPGGPALTATAGLGFVAGGNLTKSGGGTLTLTGANTYASSTVVTAGTLRATTAAYTNTILGAATGGLDVQNTAIVQLDYTGGTSPVATVKQILDGGYANGFTAGQIRSTVRAAGLTIGYGDNAAGVVTIRVTLPGDADLDGDVDFGDFVNLQSSFGQSNTTFAQGNFDYNAQTDFGDFVLLQSNFGKSLTGGRAEFSREQYAAVMSITEFSQVPEPAVLSLVGLGAAGLLRRRRAC